MRIFFKALGWLIAVALCLVAVFTLYPDALSIFNEGEPLTSRFPYSQIISVRSLLAVGIGAIGLIFGVAAILRIVRHEGGVRTGLIAMVLILVTAGHLTTLVNRGVSADGTVTSGPVTSSVEDWDGDVTVLSFNTFIEGADLVSLAVTARDADADVIVLPETTESYGHELAALLEQDGYQFTVYSDTEGERLEARSEDFSEEDSLTVRTTTVLVSSALGEYTQQETDDTWGRGAVYLTPENEGSPVILGIHTYPPLPSMMDEWASSVSAVAGICQAEEMPSGMILAGDFNATRDHAVLRDMGECADALEDTGVGGLSTWHTSTHTEYLGATIDHIFNDPNTWEAQEGQVVTIDGSDHRAVIVRFSAAS